MVLGSGFAAVVQTSVSSHHVLPECHTVDQGGREIDATRLILLLIAVINKLVYSDSFLQGIFLTQELNPGLLHCRQVL